MRDLARQIVSGGSDPMGLAHEIHYVTTYEADPDCPVELRDQGWEFFDLYEHCWIHQDKAESKAAYESLIREAAEAFLDGRPLPEWQDRGGSVPWRPP
jgi:hypothetical protein